jgi:hypothetical protein
MVPGRTGSSQGSAPAGRAVNNKKRGNVASGVNVNLPGQPMMPGFGGGGDESAVNMFTDGMQGQGTKIPPAMLTDPIWMRRAFLRKACIKLRHRLPLRARACGVRARNESLQKG